METVNFNAREPVVILGFGQMGQVDHQYIVKPAFLPLISKISPSVLYVKVLANFLSNPLASGEGDEVGWPYVAFDVDPNVVKVRVF